MKLTKANIYLQSSEACSSYQQGVPAELWCRLLLDFPLNYNTKHSALIFDFENEVQFFDMLSKLKLRGVKVPYDRSALPLFSAQIAREYSDKDIKMAPLLTPYCLHQVSEGGHDAEGNFVLIHKLTKREWGGLGGFFTNVLCCREEVRMKLENSGLKQLNPNYAIE